ncbi:MAG: hypothetical protein ACI8W7_001881 [Gammaproteobacteria bacterium]|jgi:hypothetical protein
MSTKVGQGAYIAFERVGMVFAFMGDCDGIPKFPAGDNKTDFLGRQTGKRCREIAQRLPGDRDVVTSQKTIAQHAMANPTMVVVGVSMNRKNLRRAVRGENPHMAQDAVRSRQCG